MIKFQMWLRSWTTNDYIVVYVDAGDVDEAFYKVEVFRPLYQAKTGLPEGEWLNEEESGGWRDFEEQISVHESKTFVDKAGIKGLQDKVVELEGEIASNQVVTEQGFTRGQLTDAFKKIQPKGSWKGEIAATIFNHEFEICSEACVFFTGAPLTKELQGIHSVFVKSPGYYLTIGA
jgi:hypothetical protein